MQDLELSEDIDLIANIDDFSAELVKMKPCRPN